MDIYVKRLAQCPAYEEKDEVIYYCWTVIHLKFSGHEQGI